MDSQKVKQTFDLIKKEQVDGIISLIDNNRKWIFEKTSSDFSITLFLKDKIHCFVDQRDIDALKKIHKNINFHLYNSSNDWFSFINNLKLNKLQFESNISYSDYIKFIKPIKCNQLLPFDGNILRIKKTSTELKKMQASAKLTCDAVNHLKKWIKVGMTEIQVANEYWKYVSSRGASALSFETIVGFGDHSADIHGIPSNRKLKRNEIILVDCGCILDGYCSDITRCWYVGKLPKRLDDMYKAVLNSNLLGIKNIKSNMLGKQGDSICRQYIADKWNGYDIPHGVGHGIGIGEHELPGNNKIGDRKLEINSCFTIEPGIYEQDLGGIRIEDTVVMTKNGCKVLTSSCKK